MVYINNDRWDKSYSVVMIIQYGATGCRAEPSVAAEELLRPTITYMYWVRGYTAMDRWGSRAKSKGSLSRGNATWIQTLGLSVGWFPAHVKHILLTRFNTIGWTIIIKTTRITKGQIDVVNNLQIVTWNIWDHLALKEGELFNMSSQLVNIKWILLLWQEKRKRLRAKNKKVIILR